jgi:hypothetical protein
VVLFVLIWREGSFIKTPLAGATWMEHKPTASSTPLGGPPLSVGRDPWERTVERQFIFGDPGEK